MQGTAYAQDQVAETFKAVADPTRVRILRLLQLAGELCVCHVETALELTQSRASRHLAALRRAGLVAVRREGAFVHYRALTGADAEPMQAGILQIVAGQFDAHGAVRADVERALECRDRGDCGPDSGPKR